MSGYKTPPVHTRFQKGKSGNPGGRPCRKDNIGSLIKKELSEKITIQEGGKTVRITKEEALVKKLVLLCIQGKLPAMGLLLKLRPEIAEELSLSAEDQALIEKAYKKYE